MVEAGLRGVSGFWLRTTRPVSGSTMTKLTALGGSRSEAMRCVIAAGAAVPSAAHAQAGVQQINASAARSNKFNLHALNRHVSQVSGNAMRCQAPDRQRRNSIEPRQQT